MLATFCLRLACGLLGSLVLLFSQPVNPRFFRTHFLIAMGLLGLAALSIHETSLWSLWWLSWILSLAGIFLGILVWSIEGIRGGKLLVILTFMALTSTLSLPLDFLPDPLKPVKDLILVPEPGSERGLDQIRILVDNLTSAALLGSVTTAMLLGHSYLIAPTMSTRPLMRLLTALFVAVGVRLVVATVGLYFWTDKHSLGNLEDVTALWLPLRWGLGLAGPLILGWMARETAKIRSTQSATGILYVAVIFSYLGELTSLLLLRQTGIIL